MTRWTEFVRAYAKDNNIAYGCALTEASDSYHEKYGTKKSPKARHNSLIREATSAGDKLETKIKEVKQKKAVQATLRNIKSGVEKRKEFAKKYLDSNIPP